MQTCQNYQNGMATDTDQAPDNSKFTQNLSQWRSSHNFYSLTLLYFIYNKRSKDHTPRAPALSCNVLDLDSIGRCGFILQAAPDHDSP